MTLRILSLAALAALMMSASALAATTAGTTNAGATTGQSQLSKSDEDFLSEMPDVEFPGAAEMQDKDKDGIVDSDQNPGSVANPFTGTGEEDKPKVKYVYKPGSNTTLRRTIQDDRVEDGYVQDLMQNQRGPQ